MWPGDRRTSLDYLGTRPPNLSQTAIDQLNFSVVIRRKKDTLIFDVFRNWKVCSIIVLSRDVKKLVNVLRCHGDRRR